MKRITYTRLVVFVFLLVGITAGSVMADTTAVGRQLLGPVMSSAAACTTVVNAGQSIQAALSNAQTGHVVCVRTGVYKEQVTFNYQKQGITLQAYPGEKPIIDGQGTIPTQKYQGLIQVNANGSIVDGFEVRNSAARGIVVSQYGPDPNPIRNVIVRNSIVRDSWDMGIIVLGAPTTPADNILIENNVVHNNLRVNTTNHVGGSGLLFVESKNGIARGNIVYNNLGEGLVAGRFSSNITFEDNIVYDNKHANVYLSATINPFLQRNLIFCTNDRNFWRGTKQKPAPGLTLRDETFTNSTGSAPPSRGQVIINNIVVGCGNNFWVATQIGGGGLNDAIVANNTFVNARGDAGSSANNVLIEGDVSLSNTKFINNLIYQSDPSAAAAHMLLSLGTPNMTTFTLANNLYSQAPSRNWPANEPGRVLSDPKLVNPIMPVKGSVPNANGYGIQTGSPAVNAGTAISRVTDDFFKQLRSGVLDIGADEIGGPPPTTGRILVSVISLPSDSAQLFSFSTSYAPNEFQLAGGGTHDSGQLATGTYSVQMTPVDGWQTSATCSDNSQPGSISLSGGETVTCTFTNEEERAAVTRIIIKKLTIPQNDPQSFTFQSNFAADFALTHNGQKSFDVDPGVYNVAEIVPEGWTQESAICSDGSPLTNIDVSNGETVTCTFVNRKTTSGGIPAIIYVTTNVDGNIGGPDGLAYSKGDILAYDGRTGGWSIHFDGSDVGILKPLNDFVLMPDNSILVTVSQGTILRGQNGTFKSVMWDVARFVPTTLGPDTSGYFEVYFDGSDAGLSQASEKIDALARTPDGSLLISTYGAAKVPGAGSILNAQDEDLLAFRATSWGANTQGAWSVAFNGTPVPGMNVEDVTSAWYDSAKGYYLSVTDGFTINGLTGTNQAVLAFPPSGSPTVFWNAGDAGLPTRVDGLHIVFTP